MRRARTRSGVTMLEVVVSIAIFTSLIAGIGAILSSMIGLSERSRAGLAASEGNRVALERISNVLRGADAASLAGFNGSGVAVTPQFCTATGMASGARTLSTVATLQWQPAAPARGVANPGDVVLVRDGVPVRVAAHVPAGGFSVTRRGDSLLVHVETFAVQVSGDPSHASGDALVRLRN